MFTMTFPNLGYAVQHRSSDDPSRGTCLLSHVETRITCPNAPRFRTRTTSIQRGSDRQHRPDDILSGGLDSNRLYLYEGRPGTGKTTLALQFLIEGARNGERTLYISLSENQRELTVVARRHGWSLDGIDIFELVSPETTLDPARELTVLHPAEMELNETTQLAFERVRETNPPRVVDRSWR